MSDTFDIDPGDLRYRVQIQQNNPTKDSNGQDVDDWSQTLACRWMNIEPASGTHFVATEQVRNMTTHKVTLRYFEGLTTRHRFLYKSRIFNILSVINEGEFNVRHTVLVQEVV
jgi:SPP1 family predicted phage head-tail adaptor